MAFYPDELSPIDRIRSLGKQADSLSDIGPLKNRRQWKSLVLGKKDMGMNNFATIAEEKEEEMSSDGSQGPNTNIPGSFPVTPGTIPNKKITFPKPRKYITSRVSNRKDDVSFKGVGSTAPFLVDSPIKDILDPVEFPNSKAAALPKAGKSKEFIPPSQDFIHNYAINEIPIESQWNEAFSEGPNFGWRKPSSEKLNPVKSDSGQGLKTKHEDKRKSSGSSKSSGVTETTKREQKRGKKKGNPSGKKTSKEKSELPSTSSNTSAKKKPEKGKALNMKEVVNVYKNLAYGSKDEIKSFVENLSFVKDETKAESDKNLLSMMNLKVLENKIKNFTKRTTKTQEPSTSKEKRPKVEKPVKKNRKAHIERLARHKTEKKIESVPAVPEKPPEAKEKRPSDQKEPWKYVGMESALDKTYFVYPAYPPSVNLKNIEKPRKISKGAEKPPAKQKPRNVPDSKVKVVVKGNLTGGGTSSRAPKNRSSATTVCTVKFGQKKSEEPPGGHAPEHSLLVYLHGTKATHVRSPYADKQFSRVKFFRKDERGMPLIRGVNLGAPSDGCRTVSVRNVGLPEKPTSFRSLLDFDEDIQTITDFLRSQESPGRRRQEEPAAGGKKSEWWPREPRKEQDPVPIRERRQQHLHGRPQHHHHPPRQECFSPDSIINEISKNISHLQYLPDTEDNRKLVGHFFDELDHRIEASRKGALTFQEFPPGSEPFGLFPILGY